MIPGPYGTKDGEVIAFGPSAGKDYFRRAAAEQPGDAGSRLLYCGTRVLPFLVDGGSVANCSSKNGRIASSTSGNRGVVAIASR